MIGRLAAGTGFAAGTGLAAGAGLAAAALVAAAGFAAGAAARGGMAADSDWLRCERATPAGTVVPNDQLTAQHARVAIASGSAALFGAGSRSRCVLFESHDHQQPMRFGAVAARWRCWPSAPVSPCAVRVYHCTLPRTLDTVTLRLPQHATKPLVAAAVARCPKRFHASQWRRGGVCETPVICVAVFERRSGSQFSAAAPTLNERGGS